MFTPPLLVFALEMSKVEVDYFDFVKYHVIENNSIVSKNSAVQILASGQGVEGFKGRKHLAREPKQSPAALFVRTEPSRTFCFSLIEKFFARPLKNCKAKCSARQCRFLRHGGGAGRIGFFQEFLLK